MQARGLRRERSVAMHGLGTSCLGVAVLLLLASPPLVHGLNPQKEAKPIAQPDYTIYHRK